MTTRDPAIANDDFSLVLGGPLYRLWVRTSLIDDGMESVKRCVVLTIVITWLPLLLLSFFEGHALRDTVKIPFSLDFGAHSRFLVALPLLIAAEWWIQRRLGSGVRKFIERNIIVDEDIPKFYDAVQSACRIRNSVAVEVGLLLFVYTFGLWFTSTQAVLSSPSWYANPDGTSINLTLAGFWLTFISIPFFQFVLLRWYFRFVIWFRFLWQVSKLKLHLVATHPDRAAGLGFLSRCTFAFAPILFAEGALLAGIIANEVMHNSRDIMEFKVRALGFVIFIVVAIVIPVLSFVPDMINARHAGLALYGNFASEYVEKFQRKWIMGSNTEGDPVLGTGDIQSLADLGNSYTVVREMRMTPFGWQDILRLAAVTAAPLIPLSLFVFSIDELIDQLVKTLF